MGLVRFFKIRGHFCQEFVYRNADIYRKPKFPVNSLPQGIGVVHKVPVEIFRSRHVAESLVDAVLFHFGRHTLKESDKLPRTLGVEFVIWREYF